MICKFCGNEIDDNSDFCFICGQKVEAQQVAPVAAQENVYSEPQAAAPVAVEAAPEAPVYQAPVAPVAPVAEPEESSKMKKKKAKKVKDPSAASKAARFFSFLIPIIGLILYSKAKKAGNEQKAVAVLNALMTGVCVWLAVINVVLFKKFIL